MYDDTMYGLSSSEQAFTRAVTHCGAETAG